MKARGDCLHKGVLPLQRDRIEVRTGAAEDFGKERKNIELHGQAVFASRNAWTRYEIAQTVSRELPDLAPWLPRPKKIWMSEDRWLGMFDAASLALTFYDTRKKHAHSLVEMAN